MTGKGKKPDQAAEPLSRETLARLWPNRVHESSWLKSLACHLGLHRWQDMQFGSSRSVQVARFCRWCSKIEDF